MSGKKLQQLFQAARQSAAPEPSAGFAEEVVDAIRREPPSPPRGAPSLFDELNALFPRLALATLAVMALGVAANLALGTADLTVWGDGVAQISAPWFLLPEGF